MEEVWKEIPDYEGLYEISSWGRIRSIPHTIRANVSGGTRTTKECERKSAVGWHGYVWTSLSKDGKSKTFSVHRLVATTFIENPHGLPAVNHKDGNKENNHVENLEWCTNSENQLHASINGLFKRAKKVMCIETGVIYRNSCEAQRQTGINSRTIRGVCSGEGITAGGYTWKNV